MEYSTRGSLKKLQEQINDELVRMHSNTKKRKSLDLRHSLGNNPQEQLLKSTIRKLQSLKSFQIEPIPTKESNTAHTTPNHPKPLSLKLIPVSEPNIEKSSYRVP